MGHRTVDALVDLLANPDRPALRRATAEEMATRLPYGAPDAPQDFARRSSAWSTTSSPTPGATTTPATWRSSPPARRFLAALADFIASALNVYVGSWMEGAGPSHVELVVLDWFKRWIGYPQVGGLPASGGSAANLTALICAREALHGAKDERAVLYVGDQGHSSILRAARALGFRADQVRVLPSDLAQRLAGSRPSKKAIRAQRLAAGRRPLLVAAAAGATSTGAVDPLRGLRRRLAGSTASGCTSTPRTAASPR